MTRSLSAIHHPARRGHRVPACLLLLSGAALFGCGAPNDNDLDQGTTDVGLGDMAVMDAAVSDDAGPELDAGPEQDGGPVLDGGLEVDGGSASPCSDASECDDGVACTIDTCGAAGDCLHTPTAALCPSGRLCDPTDGCMAAVICGSPADCVDNDPCTRNEVCNAATATCSFTLLDNDMDGQVPLVCGGTDCDDSLASVGLGGDELCGNGADDDCDGTIDTDATLASDPLTLLNSEAHCGACGNACAQGQTCYLGACVPCGDSEGAPCCDTFCTSTTSCTGGACSNGGACLLSGATATCTASCGARGEPCCPGDVCDAGSLCGAGNCIDPLLAQCPDAGPAALYRLSMFDIPTPTQASMGAVVGHDLDGRGAVCGVPDYAGNVDNAFIDLADALPALNPADPILLQAEIDNALNCPVGSPSCVRVDIIVRVQAGSDCGVFQVLDGVGLAAQTLAGPFNATVDGAGNFSGQVPSLALVIPYSTGSNVVDINIHLTGVIITGTLGTNALTNVVLGGTLLRADFETTIQNLLPLFGGNIEFEDIAPILANLYDVQVGGMCAGLSTGFLASGPRLP